MNQQNNNGLESKCNSASGVIDKPFTREAFIFNTMEEIWKDVKGYEGLYQVSNLGKVKSLPKVGSVKENILKNFIKDQGYLAVTVSKNDKRKTYLNHRLLAISFIPNPENKLEVNHKNGIKDDNRVDNLEWCTHSENIKHAYDNNLLISRKGESHHNTKLSDQNISEILNNYSSKSQLELSKIYKVSRRQINNIINKKSWKHIQR